MNNLSNNIIITIDWFLPGTNAGGPVRSIKNLVDQLTDFTFYIVTRDTDYCESEPYKSIASNEWVQHSNNTFVYYFSQDKLNKENIYQLINSVDAQAIFINGIYSKYFSRIPIEIALDSNLITIVSSRGMLSPHALEVKPFKKKLFIWLQNMRKRYENVHFHVTNEEEKTHLRKIISDFQEVTVIPNLPRKSTSHKTFDIDKKEGKVKFIALGRVAEEKGTLTGLESLKKVTGEVELDIYGTIYNESYWNDCKAIINDLPQNVSVNYRGTVEASKIIETIQQYHFLLLPSKGENYGHSIVESFQAGRPVIISKHTPWKNLQEKEIGYDVNEVELANAIQKAVDMNQKQFSTWSQNAYNFGASIANDATAIENYRRLFLGDS